MNDTVRALLRDLPSRLKSAYVFPSATGETPLDGRNLMNRVFLPALEAAKIKGLRWHDLRHTFASRLVMAGVDLRTVQELLGHKTIAMTERYSHLSPAHRLDAVQRLNQKPTDTATDTKPAEVKTAVGAPANLIEFPKEISAPGVIRTPDLQIRSVAKGWAHSPDAQEVVMKPSFGVRGLALSCTILPGALGQISDNLRNKYTTRRHASAASEVR